MISGGTNGAWIVLGLISFILAKMGILLIVGGTILGGSLAAAVGVVLIGLATTLVLSQVLSASDKTELFELFNDILIESLSFIELVASSSILIGVLLVILISTIYEVYKQYLSFVDHRRKWCLIKIKLYYKEA